MPLLINGVDLATTLAAAGVIFRVARRASDLAPAVGAPATRPTGDDFGERLTGAGGTVGPRTLRIEGSIEATSATTLELARDALVARCAGFSTGPTSREVLIQLVPDGGGNGRQWTGYLTSATEVTRRDPTGLARRGTVTLVFVCPDPRAYSVTEQSVALSTTGASVPLGIQAAGALATRPRIVLPGPWTLAGGTQQRVVYYDGAGTLRMELVLVGPAGAVASGQSVEVDCAAQSVVHVSAAGVRTPRAGWLFAGDFFALDPAHRAGSVAPVLAVGAGTGTAYFRDAWR